MIMMKVIIKITKTKRSSNQMIALDVVIIDTKKVSDAQPVNTSAKFVQEPDIFQKCVSSKMRNSSTSSYSRHMTIRQWPFRCQMNHSMMPTKSTCHLMMTLCITTWFMSIKPVSNRSQPKAANSSKSNIL